MEAQRDDPHQVEIETPETGLGKRMDAMDAFCRERSYAYPPDARR